VARASTNSADKELELVGGHRHVVLGVRMPEPREAVGTPIESVTLIDDHRDHGAALAAGGSPTGPEATHG
jgi:hypothetical protein